MKSMKMFIDTHDSRTGTFPDGVSKLDFAAFYEKYTDACRLEGVINMKIHVGMEEGRAFCLNLAPDADAVRRAHERVGMRFDGITEVSQITPSDLFAAVPAA